jgi:hypothetical protein
MAGRKIDRFFEAWLGAGFQPVGHIVFRKSYSSKSRFLRYQHEQAFLLAKGRPPLPKQPLGDVIDMPYSGNRLHPTQKPITALVSLIRSFSLQGETVINPFAGSGTHVRQHFSRVASTLAWRWMTHTFISLPNAFREFTIEPPQGGSLSFEAVNKLLGDLTQIDLFVIKAFSEICHRANKSQRNQDSVKERLGT